MSLAVCGGRNGLHGKKRVRLLRRRLCVADAMVFPAKKTDLQNGLSSKKTDLRMNSAPLLTHFTLHSFTLHIFTLQEPTLQNLTLQNLTLHKLTLPNCALHNFALHKLTLHNLTLHNIASHMFYVSESYVTQCPR